MDDPVQMLHARLAGRRQADLAAEIGCTTAHVNAVLNRKKPPGPTVLKFLGLERQRVNVYRKLA